MEEYKCKYYKTVQYSAGIYNKSKACIKCGKERTRRSSEKTEKVFA